MTNFDFFGEMLFEEAKFYLEIAKNKENVMGEEVNSHEALHPLHP